MVAVQHEQSKHIGGMNFEIIVGMGSNYWGDICPHQAYFGTPVCESAIFVKGKICRWLNLWKEEICERGKYVPFM